MKRHNWLLFKDEGGGAAGDGKAADTNAGAGGDGKTADDGKGGKGDEGKGGDGKAGDGKAGDDTAGKGGEENKGGEKPEGQEAKKAPEKYALQLPKDQEYLEEGDIEAIELIARGKDMSNKEAQAMLDQHVEAVAAQSARFLAETEKDPVYGGKNKDATLKAANQALDSLRPKGTPRGDAFRKMLTRTGYGNNLEVIALLADLGKMMAEDGTLVGSTGSDGKTAEGAAAALYGKTTG